MSKMKRRRCLTQVEWDALSQTVRQTTECLAKMELILGETLTVQELKPFLRAFGKIQSLRIRLDSLASSQYNPNFENTTVGDASKLFFGPDHCYHANWR